MCAVLLGAGGTRGRYGQRYFSGLLKIACTASDAAFKSKRFVSGVCELHFLGGDALA